jgi:hypothetical protein
MNPTPGQTPADAMATEHADHGHAALATYDDVNIRSIALVGGVGSVLVFVAVVAVQVIYFRYQDAEFDRKVISVPIAAANEVITSQRGQLDTVGASAGPDLGTTSVAIDDAMSQVLAEYRRRQPDGGGGEKSPAESAPAAATGETTTEAEKE